MTKIISYIWQLPQNLVGLFVILFSNAEYDEDGYWTTNYRFGVSLGWYIIVNKNCSMSIIKHERGHQKQSLYLGPLYLIVIGIFSAIGNILHRFIKFNYYKQPWEAWADKLGGVNRQERRLLDSIPGLYVSERWPQSEHLLLGHACSFISSLYFSIGTLSVHIKTVSLST